MLSLENLIIEIKKLESTGIIHFDEFERLPYKEIRETYFLMPNPTQMEKAKIKIRDQRNGHNGPSRLITEHNIYKDNKVVRTEIKTEYF